MEASSSRNKCCQDEQNITTIDGTNVCIRCGVVMDYICFLEKGKSDQKYIDMCYINSKNEDINGNLSELIEYSERSSIDVGTSIDALDIYRRNKKMNPKLRKYPLLAASLYSACKKIMYREQ